MALGGGFTHDAHTRHGHDHARADEHGVRVHARGPELRGGGPGDACARADRRGLDASHVQPEHLGRVSGDGPVDDHQRQLRLQLGRAPGRVGWQRARLVREAGAGADDARHTAVPDQPGDRRLCNPQRPDRGHDGPATSLAPGVRLEHRADIHHRRGRERSEHGLPLRVLGLVDHSDG